jgi:hypothetical protein
VETYSSSKHIYADLGIPEGTKGRIAKARVEKPAGEKVTSERPRSDKLQESKPAAPKRNRERRRNYKNASEPKA